MYKHLCWFSAIHTMNVIESNVLNTDKNANTAYFANKESIENKLTLEFAKPQTHYKLTLLKKPKKMISSCYSISNYPDNSFAIKNVLENGLFLNDDFLNYKIDNHTLGEELQLLAITLYQFEEYVSKQHSAFDYFIDKLQDLVHRTGFESKTVSDEDIHTITDNLNSSLQHINDIAEIIQIYKYEKHKGPHNNIVNEGVEQKQYNKQVFFKLSYNSSSSIKYAFLTNCLVAFKTKMDSLISNLEHNFPNENIKKLKYEYLIFSGILSSFDQMFLMLRLILKSRTMDAYKLSAAYVYWKPSYCTFLYNAARECNVNILLLLQAHKNKT